MKPLLLGILGGGQLGQMLALSAIPLGVRSRVYEPASAPPCEGLTDLWQGEYDDATKLAEFCDELDALSFEFENVPVAALEKLAARVPLHPPVAALAASQDRLIEKQFFQELGIATSPFAAIDSLKDLEQAVARFGFPAILKTRRLGYDGKGQALLRAAADLAPAFASLGGRDLILEGFVRFRRELSIISVRGRDGQIRYYDLTENHHRDGILRTSIAPAPNLTTDIRAAAEAIAARTLNALQYVGTLAIELFDTEQGLVVNEMAPRVHNSGHWTIEGAVTSQFENHVRAVLGLPLGETTARGIAVMKNLIGDAPASAKILSVPGAALHLYGKAPKPGRKLGHVTIVSSDERAAQAALQQLEQACH